MYPTVQCIVTLYLTQVTWVPILRACNYATFFSNLVSSSNAPPLNSKMTTTNSLLDGIVWVNWCLLQLLSELLLFEFWHVFLLRLRVKLYWFVVQKHYKLLDFLDFYFCSFHTVPLSSYSWACGACGLKWQNCLGLLETWELSYCLMWHICL